MYKTLVVVDDDTQITLSDTECISFSRYLAEYPKAGENKTRIINLCNTSRYLSQGYYCSLLAEARKHKIMPSVSTINDLRIQNEDPGELGLILSKLPKEVTGQPTPEYLMVYFGWVQEEAWKKTARQLFEKFKTPVLKVAVHPGPAGISLSIVGYGYNDLSDSEKSIFHERLRIHISQIWKNPVGKKHRWDMAILVNPQEKRDPPSDPQALKRFLKAASKVGIRAELVTHDQSNFHLSQYDALFIRETTYIDHYTYRMSRQAEKKGLVVIDDPTSILRCCNKIFLQDAFTYNNVSAPKTEVVAGCSSTEIEKLEDRLGYPMVIKMPESSFSSGVFKVDDREQLISKLQDLFKDSAMILVQEFLYTEFDWRIGMLNGRPIFACKYMMARNHWQIYNNNSKKDYFGAWETLPTFEAPKAVLDIAIKACAIIGNGLYGVDIKQKGNQVYVIEINDNPSVDHTVEDQYLGDELYMMIMQEFVNRLEQRGRDR
jgi:glutathione synthase/RimK-type ligase-like ATP-grasp enzyme